MKQYAIAVVTGTRAEYGLLSRVIAEISNSEALKLRLVVTGAHLSVAHGETKREIEADGIPVFAEIPILQFEDSSLGVARTVALAIDRFAMHWSEHRPDVVLLLGDRYEIFAAATAAAVLDIPVAHISGGDVTLGAQDEFFRHSVTKMAKLHFPSAKEAAARLVCMGEAPGTVHFVGGLGDENIRKMPLVGRKELGESIGFSVVEPFLLITFHPETQGSELPTAQMQELLSALGHFPNYRLLFTKANADAGGIQLNQMLDKFCANRPNAVALSSLGLKRYLSAMSAASVVVGNSSSGVVETPSFRKPAVNIGNRQAGRPICANVLCCEAKEKSIVNALQTALSPDFQKTANTARSPYDGGDTSKKIVRILTKSLQSGSLSAPKVFYDAEQTKSGGRI